MRHSFALLLLAASLTSSGCALIEDAARNTLVEVCRPLQEHKEKKRNRRWAEEAWSQVQPPYGGACLSADYARGFKDGYAEYLFRGGDGEPPVVAPLHYRQVKYQTPQGYQAVQDWFAGYRHGAIAARNSGAREVITGPSALRLAPTIDPGHRVVPYVEHHHTMPVEVPAPLAPHYIAPQPREVTRPQESAPLPREATPLPREALPLPQKAPMPPPAPFEVLPVPQQAPMPPTGPFEVYPIPETRYAPEHTPNPRRVQAQFGLPSSEDGDVDPLPEVESNWVTSPLRLHLGLPSGVDHLPTSPPIAREDIEAVRRLDIPAVTIPMHPTQIVPEMTLPDERPTPPETPEPPTLDPMRPTLPVKPDAPRIAPDPVPEVVPQDPLIFTPKPSIKISEIMEFAKPKETPKTPESAEPKPPVPESLLFTAPPLVKKVEHRTAPETIAPLPMMPEFTPLPKKEPRPLPPMAAPPLRKAEPRTTPTFELPRFEPLPPMPAAPRPYVTEELQSPPRIQLGAPQTKRAEF